MMTDAYILYDDNCPACSAYTAGFVRMRMLSPEGRLKYSEAPVSVKDKIDTDRARHEIALVNLKEGRTLYGLDSLLWIIFRNSKPLLRGFRSFPLYHVLRGLYTLISYNRRVISPVRDYFSQGKCAPDFHSGWRVAFILISGIITAAVALPFFKYSPVTSLNELSIPEFAGLWLFSVLVQGMYATLTTNTGRLWQRFAEYAGQSSVVSVIGSILLSPFLFMAGKLAEPAVFLSVFLGSYLIMLLLHIRRMRNLNFHFSVSIIWILFRIWMLVFLFPDMLTLLK